MHRQFQFQCAKNRTSLSARSEIYKTALAWAVEISKNICISNGTLVTFARRALPPAPGRTWNYLFMLRDSIDVTEAGHYTSKTQDVNNFQQGESISHHRHRAYSALVPYTEEER